MDFANWSDRELKAIKPEGRRLKYADPLCRGLYMHVEPNGRKVWRLRLQGARDTTATLGEFPGMCVEDSRAAARRLRQGPGAPVSPAPVAYPPHRSFNTPRPVAVAAPITAPVADWLEPEPTLPVALPEPVSGGPTLGALIDEFFGAVYADKRESTRDSVMDRLAVFEPLRDLPAAAVTSKQLHTLLLATATTHGNGKANRRRGSGRRDTAGRARALIRNVFDYGITHHALKQNPVFAIMARFNLPSAGAQRKALDAYVTAADFGPMVRKLWQYRARYRNTITVPAAIKFLCLTSARFSEVMETDWSEFDLNYGAHGLWRIPGERMKMTEPHLVPLSRQAREIIETMALVAGLTSAGVAVETVGLVFPSSTGKPISESTVNARVLKDCGGGRGKHTAHGFRSSFSTMLNEAGESAEVIEMCQAHKDASVRAIYNRGPKLAKRAAVLQTWADMVDKLIAG